MHTIVILSDTLTPDSQIVKKLHKLFPDCNVQIFSKTVEESNSINMDSFLKGYFQNYKLNNQKIETADYFKRI